MTAHTASTSYQASLADDGAALATRAGSVATAQSTLATALAAASTAYTTNDGGKSAAAIAAAWAAYDASVKAANVISDAVAVTSEVSHKHALGLPL